MVPNKSKFQDKEPEETTEKHEENSIAITTHQIATVWSWIWKVIKRRIARLKFKSVVILFEAYYQCWCNRNVMNNLLLLYSIQLVYHSSFLFFGFSFCWFKKKILWRSQNLIVLLYVKADILIIGYYREIHMNVGWCSMNQFRINERFYATLRTLLINFSYTIFIIE